MTKKAVEGKKCAKPYCLEPSMNGFCKWHQKYLTDTAPKKTIVELK